ncbi:hypothetical protein OK016_26295 [Vibrio chagasii]|nr:hypothetical protein [Vibrio chagasii]
MIHRTTQFPVNNACRSSLTKCQWRLQVWIQHAYSPLAPDNELHASSTSYVELNKKSSKKYQLKQSQCKREAQVLRKKKVK